MKKLQVLMITLLVTFVGAVSAHHKKESSIKESTAPSSKLYRMGDDVPVAVAPVVEAGPRDGQAVYQASCAMCHTGGIAGAPKAGDVSAWTDRLAKGEEALFSSALNGIAGTGMAAKGGCASCSDDEVTAAVTYMLALLN